MYLPGSSSAAAHAVVVSIIKDVTTKQKEKDHEQAGLEREREGMHTICREKYTHLFSFIHL